MNLPDLINGSFELFGAACLWTNVIRLWKDKKISGVHWAPTLFFFLWGFWNLFYYPHLHQWLSFVGSMGVVVVNGIWLSLLVYFHFKEK